MTKLTFAKKTDSFPGSDVNGAGQETDDRGSKAQELSNIVKLQCYFLPDFFIPLPPRRIQKQKTSKSLVIKQTARAYTNIGGKE